MSNIGLGQLVNLGDLDLTSVSTEYPVASAGMYAFKITDSKVEPGKKDPNSLLWNIVLTMNQPGALDKSGHVLPDNFKITHRVGMTPTEKRTADMVLRDVAIVLDSVFGEAGRKQIQLATFDVGSIIGADVVGKVSIEPEQNGFPEQNRVRLVKKAA